MSRYVDTINFQKIDCEPTVEDIRKALREGRLEPRHYQDPSLVPEWEAAARSTENWGLLVRHYHASRIAYLVTNQSKEPITIRSDGFILDGNHRVRAAIFCGQLEIEVIVLA